MKNIILNVCLSLFSFSVTVFLLEFGVRLYKHEHRFKNFWGENRNLVNSAYPAEFNRELGWIPQEGKHPKNIWNTRVNIIQDGIRSNGNNNQRSKINDYKIILAVGDSFTFGDQVSNNETWPAVLERISGAKVINGGVFGYGIDQTYLRMNKLALKYQPDTIIFSFYSDDIMRCELSERTSVPKPYFELLDDGNFVLRNGHIPSSITPPSSPDFFKNVLGYSFFFHKVMLRVFPEYWLQGDRWKDKRIHSYGIKVACHIFQEIAKFSKIHHVAIYILIQYTKDEFRKEHRMAIVNDAINCIDWDMLQIIDLRHSLISLKKHNQRHYENLFQGHMTAKGNFWVASELNKRLKLGIHFQ